MKAQEALSLAPEELRRLYTVLEMEFHPLDMVEEVAPCIE